MSSQDTSNEIRLGDLLACPRCDKTPLQPKGDGWRCDACKVDFPAVDGIPWMFAEPDSSLAEWRARLHFELTTLAHEIQRIEHELKDGGLHELTRQRLQSLRQASDQHRSTLRQLLEPVDVQTPSTAYETYLALRTRLPSDQGLQTYYANVHRDWAWGDEENTSSLEQIRKLAELSGGSELGNTLVLGAGACRLAYDIHESLDTACCIAVDFNPLLMLIAKRILAGETLQLHEFPIAPRTSADAAVLRDLKAPAAARDGLYLVLGDVLRPAFARGKFDTVITPWLIDIVAEDFPVFAARINALLGPRGRWINFGSLAFEHARRSRRYSLEEVLSFTEQAGFEAPQAEEATIPYMCSPASRHGRRERVVTFAAVKAADVKHAARHQALPDWLVTGKEPVPALPSFRTQAMSTQVYTFIMSLIDGKRTIEDIASILEKQQLMTAAEAEPALRKFLTKMYDDSERQSRF